jgi:TRAP-type uncharacterized transport system substrate-binding protein
MRLAAIVLSALILGTSLAATSVLPVRAAEFGTREEAVAMVRRVQEKFKKSGPEATFKALNNGERGFIDRDLYVFVHKIDGTQVVAASAPAMQVMVGKNTRDMKDQDGKFTTQDFMRIANTPPYHGWSDFRWLNPKTNTVEDKSAWIERMGDYYVGVGIYKNEQPNENTVGVISGSPNSDDTYLQMAYDLADVLNDGDNLRILPIAGVGGPRNIRDVRYLRGVDIGLTQTNILNSFRRSNERMGQYDDKIVYIAKLFNEEVHLVAKPNITSIEQLRGLKVNLDAKGGGTSYSMRDLFKAFGIEVEEVSMSQVEALEKVKSGEIAATALIAGKPVRSMSKLSRTDRLHFVQIPYPTQLIGDYLPATLTHDDYPELIASGGSVDTIAVGAVLIAYNWQKTNVDRYRRVQRFVEAFFPKIGEFQKPPRHVKWREVNLAANLPGWTRFEVAQAWLDSQRQEQPRNNANSNSNTQMTAQQATNPRQVVPAAGARPAVAADQPLPQRADPALYEEFMRWRQMQSR